VWEEAEGGGGGCIDSEMDEDGVRDDELSNVLIIEFDESNERLSSLRGQHDEIEMKVP